MHYLLAISLAHPAMAREVRLARQDQGGPGQGGQEGMHHLLAISLGHPALAREVCRAAAMSGLELSSRSLETRGGVALEEGRWDAVSTLAQLVYLPG